MMAFWWPRRRLVCSYLRAEVGVLGAYGGVGALGQRDAQVGVAFAGVSGAPLAGGLVVGGADCGPAGGVAVGGEPVHVGAELGDDYLAVAGPDPGDRAQKLNLLRERGQSLLDLLGQRRDHLLQIVQVREDLGDDQRAW